jgi:DNA-directed RNA polymerase sigma subunit (sigma70/sigma32)
MPSNYYQVVDFLDEFPELLDEMALSEAAVLRMRYGLNEEPRPLKEISERLGLPRERVRQIESDALGKLWRLRRQLPVDC